MRKLSNFRISVAFLALLFTGAIGSTLARAASVISVSFSNNSSNLVGTTNAAGKVSVNNWNDVSIGGSDPTSGGTTGFLTDNTGASTTAKLSYPSAQQFAASPAFAAPGDTAMMSGHIYTSGNVNLDLSLTNIPYATYDLYLYYNSGGVTNEQKFSVVQTGQSAFGYETPGSDTGYVQSNDSIVTPNDANYALISGVSGGNITLRAQWQSGPSGQTPGSFAYFNGFQIVQTPEPASLSLLGICGAGLLARRRHD